MEITIIIMKNNHKKMLSDTEFAEVIKNTPLVSIDLIIKNREGKILLGRRNNEPAKNYWFVPGGRIYKNETISQAFKRISKNELNIDIDFKDARLIGPFDHIYTTNMFNNSEFGTHYVALAYEITIKSSLGLLKDTQHTRFSWFSVNKLISDPMVHENTKAFFDSSMTIPKDSGIYRALMSHYIHYDSQFWSRIQILLAIQSAALASSYSLRHLMLGPFILIVGVLFTIAILFLINRDIDNSRINQTIMDELSIKLFDYKGAGQPIYLRSIPRYHMSGQKIIQVVIILIISINIMLAYYYHKQFNDSHINESNKTIKKLEIGHDSLSSKQIRLKKEVSDSNKATNLIFSVYKDSIKSNQQK